MPMPVIYMPMPIIYACHMCLICLICKSLLQKIVKKHHGFLALPCEAITGLWLACSLSTHDKVA